ncbi:MAG: acireductone synthase [Planctomycetota bacterium]
MEFANVKGILLDIEGTTSSISFVYDVMFPFIRQHVASFLDSHWSDESLQSCLPLLAVDLEQGSVESWLGSDGPKSQRQKVVDGVIGLMDADVKATGLKQLQGLVWKSGFHSGEMVAHLFDDVAPAIQSWHQSGLDISIYSSGSISAQKLFFGHTVAGDLLDCFQGHYDTTTGPKKETESYQQIAESFGLPASQILFVSDVVDELKAASAAGLQTALSNRPGNEPVDPNHGFSVITSFDQIEIV